jgi:hypothetical protein
LFALLFVVSGPVPARLVTLCVPVRAQYAPEYLNGAGGYGPSAPVHVYVVAGAGAVSPQTGMAPGQTSKL